MIQPENLVLQVDGYSPGAWDYPSRCADVDTALAVIREKIEEWSAEADPHGFWHERPCLIALHNEVTRQRAATG